MRVALLLLAALVVPALASGDHVFSHRFVVEGRLVGGDGLPLPGVLVDVSSVGERFVEPCQELQRPVTDAWGDFRYCYHRHEVGRAGVVTVTAGNASQARPVDADLRRMVFYLRDANASGTAPEGWARTFHVDGRVWERGLTRLDGVNVSGLALDGVDVSLTTLDASLADKGTTLNLTTDGFGDYAAVVRLYEDQRPEDVTLSVRTRNATLSTSLDATFHRMTLDFALPFDVELPHPGPRPGTSSGPVSPVLALGVALALLGAVAFARKKA